MAAGYKYATVNASSVPSTQTNFPVYVDLSRLGITTLAEAQSVRVYADSSKTTEWAREIVSATEMHVKIPSLTSTTSIYVDWDGVSADYAATDTYGRNAVWSAYRAVYHGDDLTDSTGNGYNLTNTGGIAYNSGKVGKAFDSGSGNTSKYLSTTSSLGIADTDVSSTDGVTHQAWVNFYTETQFNWWMGGRYGSATRRGVRFSKNTTPAIGFSYEANGTSAVANSYSTWYMMHFFKSGSTIYMYRDGALSASTSYSSGTTTSSAGLGLFHPRGGEGEDETSALIDEVRIKIGTMDTNTITTEYNNQSAESTFWGTWSDVGGGGGYRFVPQIRPFVGL